jgi:hypothetical protein
VPFAVISPPGYGPQAFGRPFQTIRLRSCRQRQPPSSDGKCPRIRSLSTRIRSTGFGWRNGQGTRETASAAFLGPSDPPDLLTPVRRPMPPWFRLRPRRDASTGRNPGPRTGAETRATRPEQNQRLRAQEELRATASEETCVFGQRRKPMHPVWSNTSAFGYRRNFRQLCWRISASSDTEGNQRARADRNPRLRTKAEESAPETFASYAAWDFGLPWAARDPKGPSGSDGKRIRPLQRSSDL